MRYDIVSYRYLGHGKAPPRATAARAPDGCPPFPAIVKGIMDPKTADGLMIGMAMFGLASLLCSYAQTPGTPILAAAPAGGAADRPAGTEG
jgi:hypothetical protein